MNDSIDKWIFVLENLPASQRIKKYEAWRQLKTMPEDWIQYLEHEFPVQDKNPALPSALTMAKNAAEAFKKTLISTAMGNKLSRPQDEIDRIYAICKACPGGYYREKDDRCSHKKCGCYLKAKRWIQAMNCPAGYW